MIPWTLFLAWRWFVELRGKASKTSKTCQNLNIKAVQHGVFYVQFKECTLISQGYLRLKFGGKQDKILSLGNPIFKLFLTMLGRQHVECLKVRTCTNIQFFFARAQTNWLYANLLHEHAFPIINCMIFTTNVHSNLLDTSMFMRSPCTSCTVYWSTLRCKAFVLRFWQASFLNVSP